MFWRTGANVLYKKSGRIWPSLHKLLVVSSIYSKKRFKYCVKPCGVEISGIESELKWIKFPTCLASVLSASFKLSGISAHGKNGNTNVHSIVALLFGNSKRSKISRNVGATHAGSNIEKNKCKLQDCKHWMTEYVMNASAEFSSLSEKRDCRPCPNSQK